MAVAVTRSQAMASPGQDPYEVRIVTFRDESARRAMELAREQMLGELEAASLANNEFLARISHELRTPLTNLQGYLEALRDGVITADRATYESLYEEADRLVRLSRSLDALAAAGA